MLQLIIEWLCTRVAMWCCAHKASHFIRRNGELYLARFYLFGGDGEGRAPGWRGRTERCLYLHHFFTSDPDGLHNHPWRFAFSVILTGGYWEWRRVALPPPYNADRIVMQATKRRPGDVNVIRPETFHRAVLLHPERGCWTLFYAGKKTGKGWGFLNIETGAFSPAGKA